MSQVNSIENRNELDLALSVSEGYVVTVTLLNEGKLTHHLLTKNFPRLDLLPSLKKCRGLIVENLENAKDDISNPRPIPEEEVKVPESDEPEDAELTITGEEDVKDTE